MIKLDLKQIEAFSLEKKEYVISDDVRKELERSFSFLQEFSSDKIIYGINTGFGQWHNSKSMRTNSINFSTT